MIQGTSSDAGKSLVVAGLCRAFARRDLRVRPFKPQNMSNNAAVTPDGGEIGRAQALQARACGVPPSRHMNPVLLKPESERGAQVVLQGTVAGRCDARAYQTLKATLLPHVIESFDALTAEADLVIVEGAGSPAEINLRPGDIANMGFARAADVPVVLVADIERGGVFAQLAGTVAVLDPADRALLRGFVVNKFRGDPSLFTGAVPQLEELTGLPSLGVLPWLDAARLLPEEDGLGAARMARTGGPVRVAVPHLPRIANFDDLAPLAAEPAVSLLLLEPGQALPGDVDLVILPGSKATRADLAALEAEGWGIDIRAHRRRGGRVVGLCGGYQMLGRTVDDETGIEGPPGRSAGLGLLDVATTLEPAKTVRLASGRVAATGEPVHGYEIHLGRTTGPDALRPWLRLEPDRPDGAVSADGRVMGCYLHGLFAADAFRRRLLAEIAGQEVESRPFETRVEAALDAVAEAMELHLDLDHLLRIARTARMSGSQPG